MLLEKHGNCYKPEAIEHDLMNTALYLIASNSVDKENNGWNLYKITRIGLQITWYKLSNMGQRLQFFLSVPLPQTETIQNQILVLFLISFCLHWSLYYLPAICFWYWKRLNLDIKWKKETVIDMIRGKKKKN